MVDPERELIRVRTIRHLYDGVQYRIDSQQNVRFKVYFIVLKFFC